MTIPTFIITYEPPFTKKGEGWPSVDVEAESPLQAVTQLETRLGHKIKNYRLQERLSFDTKFDKE